MNNVTPLNFGAVSFAVKQINDCLLQSGSGVVLAVQVNEENNVVAAGLVDIRTALAGGFEPAKFVKGGN